MRLFLSEVLELDQQSFKLPGWRLLARRRQWAQGELVEVLPNAWTFWLTFGFSDLFRFYLVARLILKARFEFVGKQAASEKPVQGLAALLTAADPDSRW